jgi:hypothetical protein
MSRVRLGSGLPFCVKSKVIVDVPGSTDVTRRGVVEWPSTTLNVPDVGDTVTPTEGEARHETSSTALEPAGWDPSWTPSWKVAEPPTGTLTDPPGAVKGTAGGPRWENEGGAAEGDAPHAGSGALPKSIERSAPADSAVEGSHGLSQGEDPAAPVARRAPSM